MNHYIRIAFVFFINYLIFNPLIFAQTRSGSTIEDFTITITFFDPVINPVIFKAPLKYNKDFALILQMDNSDPSIHSQVMPYFKGQAGNPGLFFNERSGGDPQPFKMDATYYSFNASGADIHNYVNGYLHWDNMIDLWAGEFGLISRGLNDPPTTDVAFEVQRNASYTKRKTFSGTIPDGAEMHVYVLPPDATNQLDEAKTHNLAVYSTSGTDVNNQLVVEDLPTIAGLELARKKITTNLYEQVSAMADLSDATHHYLASYFITGFDNGEISLNQFKQEMNGIASTYGSDGLDKIWSGSATEVFEYLRIKELVTVNTAIDGNVLTLTFTGNNIPDDFRFYALTLVVQGESNIVDMVVQQPDNLSTYESPNNTALINMKWNGLVAQNDTLRAENQVTLAETITTPANALVAMDYVKMLPEGNVKQLLHDRLCALSGIDYESGFCPQISFLGDDTAICFHDTLALQAPLSAHYLWSNGDTTQSIQFPAVETTEIWAHITDGGGFVGADTIVLTVKPLPVVIITPDTVTINPFYEQILVASGAATYVWSNDSINDSITVSPLLPTSYSVTGTALDGCKNNAAAYIFVQYITNLQFSFDTVCVGDITHLVSMTVTNDSILISEWDVNGDGIFDDGIGSSVNIVLAGAGEHLIGLRIKTLSGAIHIIYNKVIVADYPNASFLINNTCEGEFVQFTNNSTLEFGNQLYWIWHFGDGNSSNEQNPNYFYETASSYDVTLINISNYGCADTVTRSFTIRPKPLIDLRLSTGVSVASEDTLIMPLGGSLDFEVRSVYDSIEWGGAKTDVFHVINSGYFNVVVYVNGCNNSRFFTVTDSGIPTNPTVGIMNLITPNGDGYNDSWIIQDLALISPAKVAIYARSGKLVYESPAYDNKWTGDYNGNPLPEGSYFYVLQGAAGTVLKGTISILR